MEGQSTARAGGGPPRLHLSAGTAADGGDPVVVTPESAAWTYTGLRVIRLAAGEQRTLATGADEVIVLPLAGGAVVECDGRRFALDGRDSVFARVTDFAYIPLDSEWRITSEAGGEFALPSARASRRLDPAYGAAEDVPVEVRGAGACTRQITNFCAPDGFPADKLLAVEVLTPEGNTSSYPPHKHDDASTGEADLEEIYYFKVGGTGGFGLHRTYTIDGTIDATVAVGSDDVFLIPRGYHGPCLAAPGYDLWYLNVLAGPAQERSMAFRDDPAHAWIRATWDGMPLDPRVPMTDARGSRR